MVLESGVTSHEYTTDIPLAPGATYSFKVEARNSVGFSLLSEPVSILAA